MAASPVVMNTNPHRPVDFKESAVAKVIATSGNVNVEKKVDGCQLNMVVCRNPDNSWEVAFLSREGKAFNGLSALADKLSGDERWHKFFNPHLDAGLFRDELGFMLQAEIQTLDDTGKPKVCAEISGDLRRMEPIPVNKIRITGFDLIPFHAVISTGEYQVFQEVRRGHMLFQIGALRSRFPEIEWCAVQSIPAFSLEHLMQVYESYRAVGEEGGVAKDPLGHWKRGKKTGQWKVKPDDECDGTVVGLMWGTPGLANEGRVIGFRVLTEHGVVVDAGGITEAQKDEFTAAVKAYKGKHLDQQSLEEAPPELVNPFQNWAVKITYMERLPSGSYRHPNFHSFRGITDPLIKE